MALHLFQMNIKARDDAALARFWAEALGWSVSGTEPGATTVKPMGPAWPDPGAVRIDFIAVPDPAVVEYRAHLELATTSAARHAELVARLKELGATSADAGPGEPSRTVLADPEGNVFCVPEPRESYRDTGPIAAVVVDCADPRAMARFWGGAVDWTAHEATGERALLRSAHGAGPFLEFVRTPHLRETRHRLHLDLAAHPFDSAGQAAGVARLKSVGATAPDPGPKEFPWQVLADPEGNEFCVLGPA
ncbi:MULTISPECIES: VOC family protein [Streptomyces]|uniref:Glyoxalase n=1 Tax=Streptomyces tsukubensis (strain DSM 42081 / NBRC 108919 / NRRL 18488 / 9993) TaxID=1114943 RepID=I2N8Y9_STRT9|nr:MULTISPECIES: VOC family protein [Streptomyces]AZK97344.1 glyoxalase [Streptomyces tsukubensis]EIF93486.1 hypothetical protein [Streptomyces tsukubensis NRRL18488]MYS67275.1 VOC family protein [Streptomyces sp. SID5473]QKM66698.1 glyoxalase [Streptomyces tsukubensis NRRL18488]TAI44955.1 VOC family protein [Streptomyces tsukubensis]